MPFPSQELYDSILIHLRQYVRDIFVSYQAGWDPKIPEHQIAFYDWIYSLELGIHAFYRWYGSDKDQEIEHLAEQAGDHLEAFVTGNPGLADVFWSFACVFSKRLRAAAESRWVARQLISDNLLGLPDDERRAFFEMIASRGRSSTSEFEGRLWVLRNDAALHTLGEGAPDFVSAATINGVVNMLRVRAGLQPRQIQNGEELRRELSGEIQEWGDAFEK
ncbi:hypothetical protein PENSPDRAFT_660038 [Peniophora sp. CONT]|nr:hypothetical protein PENSPDRAFT_660038 [Peniophora sp. CONT]